VCSEPKTFTRLNVKWFGKATLSIFGKITFYTYGIIIGLCCVSCVKPN
jgi:hypothetical protein